jgi:hypothetical protein
MNEKFREIWSLAFPYQDKRARFFLFPISKRYSPKRAKTQKARIPKRPILTQISKTRSPLLI